jgi:DNA-binding response OmpR family regulator
MIDKPSILIVDDDPRVVELLELILERNGYKVSKALSGEEALKALDEDPDLVILDIVMPGVDGLEVADRLQSQTEEPIPFIFLTAKGQPHHRLAGLGLGAVEYITKPFHPNQLLSAIMSILPTNAIPGHREEP